MGAADPIPSAPAPGPDGPLGEPVPPERIDLDAVRRRARGAYLGLAVGDALGATTEFMSPGEIHMRYGVHQDIVGGGWLHLKAGSVTDDTGMSLALGDALLEAGGMDAAVVGRHFLAWLRGKPVDVGHTVRRGLQRVMHVGTLVAPYSEYSAGNGTAMRNLPVVLATLADDAAFAGWSRAQGRITHNHPEAEAGTLMLGDLTRQAVLLGAEAPLQSLARRWGEHEPKFDFRRFYGDTDGYIVHTVRLVTHFLFNTFDFESYVVAVVNQGGDADTNGALAGALAGAFYGPDAIPARWLKQLDGATRAAVEAQADRLLAAFPPPSPAA